jgi:carboxypeptidase Taq
LLAWLRLHVHGKGASVSARELVIQATGNSLDTAAFRAHLQSRYLS